jgi:RES domain
VSKFPEPPDPDVLVKTSAAWHDLLPGTEQWRIYFRGGEHPTEWNTFRAYGPASGRFDHHLPPPRVQARRIYYAASGPVTCLAEVFQDARNVDVHRRDPWLAGFTLRRMVRLLDLRGEWPTRAGASMAINSGPRPRARRWAQAMYAAYPGAEGLWYASSMHAGPEGTPPAVALFERAEDALPDRPFFHRALADSLLLIPLRNAASALGYALTVGISSM